MTEYQFTQDWFSWAPQVWEQLDEAQARRNWWDAVKEWFA